MVTLVEVWENSKQLWKHVPSALVLTKSSSRVTITNFMETLKATLHIKVCEVPLEHTVTIRVHSFGIILAIPIPV